MIEFPNELEIYISLPHCVNCVDDDRMEELSEVGHDVDVPGRVGLVFDKLRSLVQDADLRLIQHTITDIPFRYDPDTDYMPYETKFGGFMDMVAVIDFRIRDTSADPAYTYPLDIKLKVMHFNAFPDAFFRYRSRRSWVEDILNSFDVNVDKVRFDIATRRITYPIHDEDTFFFVEAKRFYYELRPSNRNTAESINAYQRRGFEFMGYLDRTNEGDEWLHILSTNTWIWRETMYPSDHLLPEGTVPEESLAPSDGSTPTPTPPDVNLDDSFETVSNDGEAQDLRRLL
jgi:hypothetical protein